VQSFRSPRVTYRNLISCLGTEVYLTGAFIWWDILLIAVIPVIAIQGTLLALLLDYSVGSGGLLSAILATHLRLILC